MIKFRPIRGGLKEAMFEMKEFKSKASFREFIAKEFGTGNIALSHLGWDDRIKWDSYLVCYGKDPVGYVNTKDLF